MRDVQAKSNETLNKLFEHHSLVGIMIPSYCQLMPAQNYKACLVLINCNEHVDNINKHIIYLHMAYSQLLISSSSSILTLIPYRPFKKASFTSEDDHNLHRHDQLVSITTPNRFFGGRVEASANLVLLTRKT